MKSLSEAELDVECAKRGRQRKPETALSKYPNFSMRGNSKLKFSINDQLKQIDVA